jgi:hypothetical protein
MGENSIRAKVFNGEQQLFSRVRRRGQFRSDHKFYGQFCESNASFMQFFSGPEHSDLHNFHLVLLSWLAGWLVQCDNKIFYVFIL